MTGNFDHFLDWSRDATAFCELLAKTPATLKILMKTKDEVEFLKIWIDWHAPIVGLTNIFILGPVEIHRELMVAAAR
jgi:hypothetical protein